MKKLALLLSCCVACVGTETGNPPVIDFGNSGCRTKTYLLDKDLRPDDQALYEGLTCLTFEHTAQDTLHFQLTNYESGCGADSGWKPHAELRDDGGLDLVLDDDDCSTAACLWCVYDLSFTVKLDQAFKDGVVRVYQRGCGDEQLPKQAFLPIATQPAGAACAYQHSVALFERNRDVGGPRTMCEPLRGFPTPECRAGLRCTDVGEPAGGFFSGGERCLASCQTDADCSSLERCDGVVCRLSAAGLK